MKKLISKRLKFTKTGKIIKRKPGLSHNRSKRKSKITKNKRKTGLLSPKALKGKI